MVSIPVTCLDDAGYVPPLLDRTGTPIIHPLSLSCDEFIRSVRSGDQAQRADNTTRSDSHDNRERRVPADAVTPPVTRQCSREACMDDTIVVQLFREPCDKSEILY